MASIIIAICATWPLVGAIGTAYWARREGRVLDGSVLYGAMLLGWVVPVLIVRTLIGRRLNDGWRR